MKYILALKSNEYGYLQTKDSVDLKHSILALGTYHMIFMGCEWGGKCKTECFQAWIFSAAARAFLYKGYRAGLGGSVECAVRLETRRSRVQPPPRSATFCRGDWSWNIFYGHSLPSADSRRAVVSFWRKNVHNTGEPLRGLSLPSKRVVR